MFDTVLTEVVPPAWVDRPPRPGEPGCAEHQAYLVYEAQQVAFWEAYSAGDAVAEDVLPNLNGARTDAGLLSEIARQGQRENARGRGEAAGGRGLCAAQDRDPGRGL